MPRAAVSPPPAPALEPQPARKSNQPNHHATVCWPDGDHFALGPAAFLAVGPAVPDIGRARDGCPAQPDLQGKNHVPDQPSSGVQEWPSCLRAFVFNPPVFARTMADVLTVADIAKLLGLPP